jgi:hypothetical protein
MFYFLSTISSTQGILQLDAALIWLHWIRRRQKIPVFCQIGYSILIIKNDYWFCFFNKNTIKFIEFFIQETKKAAVSATLIVYIFFEVGNNKSRLFKLDLYFQIEYFWCTFIEKKKHKKWFVFKFARKFEKKKTDRWKLCKLV